MLCVVFCYPVFHQYYSIDIGTDTRVSVLVPIPEYRYRYTSRAGSGTAKVTNSIMATRDLVA